MQVPKNWKWLALSVFLFLTTFGFWAAFLLTTVALGSLVIVCHYGRLRSKEDLLISPIRLDYPSPGVKKIIDKMESTTKIRNFDKRMTGAATMDAALNEVLEYTVRDYIKTWYQDVSDHDAFLVHIWQCVQKVVITFANRSKAVDWLPYFTNKLVDDFASHIRLYRKTIDRAQLETDVKPELYEELVENTFFDLETTMEKNVCRDLICMNEDEERQYLQDLTEMLLFLLLPKEDFRNKAFRYILREVLVAGIIIPTIELFADPDYINQNVSWMCKETTFTNEIFLTVIKTTNSSEELEAVKEKIEKDIYKWRSKDTGGEGDTVIKQNLNSLLFVKNVCETRIKRMLEGTDDGDYTEDLEFSRVMSRCRNLYLMTFSDIINNNIALQSFIEFLTTVGGQQYLYFYLNVEGFQTAAEQQISQAQEKMGTSNKPLETLLEPLRKAATIIFDQYLSDKATSRLRLEDGIIKRTHQNIKSRVLTETIFDEVKAKVFQMLHGEKFYSSFLQSSLYIKLLYDMNLLPEPEGSCDTGVDEVSLDEEISPRSSLADATADEDTQSLDSISSADVFDTQSDITNITAHITQTGIIREPEKPGKTYAIYAVTVKKKLLDESDETLDIYRRYSDFHDLHMIIAERYDSIPGLVLPGKTAFKHTNKDFLEKRRKALDVYLQILLTPDVLQSHNGLFELLIQFLSPRIWEKHKSQIARKMDTLVNPLKNSVKHVGSTGRNSPDPDGLTGLGSGIKVPVARADSGKVGAGLDSEVAEDIPLRILLLLMDEVFELRHKNQWLRRRIVAILRQLIKATFGDKINRKIVDHVEWLTSADQIADYIKAFKESFWPCGILVETRPPRLINTRMRTQVACKAKMLGNVPDEMRTLMGNDTVRKGVLRVFDMFQRKTLNKRLIYVVLEGIIEMVFNDNKFPEIFCKLHSKSARVMRK